jgi:hypothetical protein
MCEVLQVLPDPQAQTGSPGDDERAVMPHGGLVEAVERGLAGQIDQPRICLIRVSLAAGRNDEEAADIGDAVGPTGDADAVLRTRLT